MMKTPKTAAVLNAYKRPHAIYPQIVALQHQSHQLDGLIINNNHSGFSFSSHCLREGIPTYEIQNQTNLGVYARFYILNNFSQFDYFIVIDDDMIPQHNFIEAQIRAFKEKEGLYVGSGIKLTENGYYNHKKVGWNGDWVKEITEVDLGGHTWFFPRKYLTAFNRMPLSKNRFNGEDIHFSFMLKKYGIKTYVAPTNEGCLPTIPQTGMDLGTDENATWKKKGHFEFRNTLIQAYINKENDRTNPQMTQHFDHIINKLNNHENFILPRFGDGEVNIMIGKTIGNSEWQFDEKNAVHRKFGNNLDHAFRRFTKNKNAIIGIPCYCCSPKEHNIMKDKIGEATATFSNIFVNANYKRFDEFLEACEKRADRVIIVGHKNGTPNIPIEVKYFGFFDNDVTNYTEKFFTTVTEYMMSKITKDTVILVAGGPASEILIDKLVLNGANCTIIDVGSAINKYIGMPMNRGYLQNNNNINKECKLYER